MSCLLSRIRAFFKDLFSGLLYLDCIPNDDEEGADDKDGQM